MEEHCLDVLLTGPSGEEYVLDISVTKMSLLLCFNRICSSLGGGKFHIRFSGGSSCKPSSAL